MGAISCAAAEVDPARTKIDEAKAEHSPTRRSFRVPLLCCSIMGPFLSLSAIRVRPSQDPAVPDNPAKPGSRWNCPGIHDDCGETAVISPTALSIAEAA